MPASRRPAEAAGCGSSRMCAPLTEARQKGRGAHEWAVRWNSRRSTACHVPRACMRLLPRAARTVRGRFGSRFKGWFGDRSGPVSGPGREPMVHRCRVRNRNGAPVPWCRVHAVRSVVIERSWGAKTRGGAARTSGPDVRVTRSRGRPSGRPVRPRNGPAPVAPRGGRGHRRGLSRERAFTGAGFHGSGLSRARAFTGAGSPPLGSTARGVTCPGSLRLRRSPWGRSSACRSRCRTGRLRG